MGVQQICSRSIRKYLDLKLLGCETGDGMTSQNEGSTQAKKYRGTELV
jgi:hypothetical protein